MIVIDFYGGPGSGKSTLAAGLFNHLKLEGLTCELSREVAKDLIYEGRTHLLLPETGNQFIVAGMQHERLEQLKRAGCKIAITDSPLLQQLVYVEWDPRYEEIKSAMVKARREYLDTISIFCRRGKEYSTFGRYQANVDEAIVCDNKTEKLLMELGIGYLTFEGNRAGQEQMLPMVTNSIKSMLSWNS